MRCAMNRFQRETRNMEGTISSSRGSHRKVFRWAEIFIVAALCGGAFIMVADILNMLGYLRASCSVSYTQFEVTGIENAARGISVNSVPGVSSSDVEWPRTFDYSPDRPMWTILVDKKVVKVDIPFMKMKMLFNELNNDRKPTRKQWKSKKPSSFSTEERQHSKVVKVDIPVKKMKTVFNEGNNDRKPPRKQSNSKKPSSVSTKERQHSKGSQK